MLHFYLYGESYVKDFRDFDFLVSVGIIVYYARGDDIMIIFIPKNKEKWKTKM